MSNFDDYFEDQSEVEQIIDDATDKLVGLISEKTKSEIERYKNWYESAAEVRDKLQKQVYEQQEKIRVLEVDLKRAKEELERKDNEIFRFGTQRKDAESGARHRLYRSDTHSRKSHSRNFKAQRRYRHRADGNGKNGGFYAADD